MTHDPFEDLMRDAAHTFNAPPEPPLNEMWQAIEPRVARRRRSIDSMTSIWLLAAAMLVIGVGIGRLSTSMTSVGPAPEPAPVMRTASTVANDEPYDVATERYLGQTAALLIALPEAMKSARADSQFVSRASDLLTTTRLLMDSPAANDPSMRSLLEDLELVLVQVVRLQTNHTRSEMDLINQAMEQHDVIPRLRTAAADISAN
ncbi:MAG TPA: hypothetical protein VHB25_18485 [Gemmatimonadaceae bacterium]|nr:hypothetical protein [Gemmatimonadaceae bacterium]